MSGDEKNARTRVKFCGVTNADDAAAAAHVGADAVGFVFYPPAPVAVDAANAARAAAILPPFVDAVALFVNPSAAFARRVIAELRPQWLQFHGDEDAAFCRQFGLPYLKACRVSAAADIEDTRRRHPNCGGLLLDAYHPEKRGGTGENFDWRLAPPPGGKPPIVIAGGLTAKTVGGLVRQARPWGVDVSGGIAADGDRRRKDWDKMAAFMRAVRDADFC